MGNSSSAHPSHAANKSIQNNVINTSNNSLEDDEKRHSIYHQVNHQSTNLEHSIMSNDQNENPTSENLDHRSHFTSLTSSNPVPMNSSSKTNYHQHFQGPIIKKEPVVGTPLNPKDEYKEHSRTTDFHSNTDLNTNSFSSDHVTNDHHHQHFSALNNATSSQSQPTSTRTACNTTSSNMTDNSSLINSFTERFHNIISLKDSSRTPRDVSSTQLKQTNVHSDSNTSFAKGNNSNVQHSQVLLKIQKERSNYKNSSRINYSGPEALLPLAPIASNGTKCYEYVALLTSLVILACRIILIILCFAKKKHIKTYQSKQTLDNSNHEEKVPVMLTWSDGGTNVFVTGTFNQWKRKIRLNKSHCDFSTVIFIPKGKHRFKFIVDDEWKCSDDLPVATDTDGNLVNFLDIDDEKGLHQQDGLDSIAEFVEVGKFPPDGRFSESPPSSYNCKFPSYLSGSLVNTTDNNHSSSRSSLPKLSAPKLEPLSLPPHLENVILNAGSYNKEDNASLPIPNHVVLNHLYACSIRDGVMAVACTTRFQKKVNDF